MALFAQVALPAPRRMGKERPGTGDNMRPRVIHKVMRSRRVDQASQPLPSFSTHRNQRALVAQRCLSSQSSVSALISISAESTRSHYAKIRMEN